MSQKRGWLKGDARRGVRDYVARRDGARCFYCRAPFPADLVGVTLDHYVPYSLWRESRPRNIVLACEPCNSRKADALPVSFAWLLLRNAAMYETAA